MAKGPRVKTIPNKVKEFRRDLAWTKAHLAREAAMAPGTLERMEQGMPTRDDRRRAVAKALGRSYEEVFPNDED